MVSDALAVTSTGSASTRNGREAAGTWSVAAGACGNATIYNHKLHGRTQWRWGRFRRIGVHLYRLRTLYRNYQGHWRRVRSYWHLWKRNHYYRSNRWFWGRHRRIGRHLYRSTHLQALGRCTRDKIRSYWHLWRKKHYNHELHGETQWRWGNYKRIGGYLYRLRALYRNYQSHWSRVWGRFRRIGYHLYRHRILKRWTGGRWVVVCRYWYLWCRNYCRYKLYGVHRWFWGRFRRFGHHLYRLRILRRFWDTRWKRVRTYWQLWKRNHYYRPNRWFWGRYRRIGRHLYRYRTLKRWTGAKWVVVRSY